MDLSTAEAAFAFSASHGVPSVTAALVAYAAGPALRSPPLRNLVAEYLLMKEAEGCRAVTLRYYRSILRELCHRFGHLRPAELAPPELATFLSRLPRPASLHTRWRTVGSFYRWLIQHGYAWENPVLRAMRKPRLMPTRGSVYTPTQAAWILAEAKDTDAIGFWALALFSGLRVAEIKRLAGHPTPWRLIRMATGVIEVPAAIAKRRPRLVPILPVLRSWLHWLQKRKVPFFPPNGEVKASALRRRLVRRLPFPTPDVHRKNTARRSYISYRLALPRSSYSAVASAAGNNEWVIRKFYRCPVDCSAATAYFALTPETIAARSPTVST